MQTSDSGKDCSGGSRISKNSSRRAPTNLNIKDPRWNVAWGDLVKIIPALIALMFGCGMVIYALVSIPSGLGSTKMDYLPQYGAALWKGRLWLAETTRWETCPHDLSFFDGKCFPYWGIFPALIHAVVPFLSDRFVAIAATIVAIYFLNRIVLMLAASLSPDDDGNFAIVLPLCFAQTLAAGFGMIGEVGRVYEESIMIAHAMGLLGISFLIPFIVNSRITDRKQNFSLMWGFLCLGLAGLTRISWFISCAALGIFLAVRAFYQNQAPITKRQALERLIVPGLVALTCVAVQIVLNWVRFDNLTETGFSYATSQLLFKKWFSEHHGVFSLRYIPYNAGIYWFTGYQRFFNEETVLLELLRRHCVYREYPGGLLVSFPAILFALREIKMWRRFSIDTLLALVALFLPLALLVLTHSFQVYRYQWESWAFFGIPATTVLLASSAKSSIKMVYVYWALLAISIYVAGTQAFAVLNLQVGSL